MKNYIRWQVFLKAKSRDKADRLLERFAQALGQEIAVQECERYWKDSSLFRAILTSPLDAEEMATAVGKTLIICTAIAGRWLVGVPLVYEGGFWEFTGTACEGTVALSGLALIEFHAGNVESNGPQPSVLCQQSSD